MSQATASSSPAAGAPSSPERRNFFTALLAVLAGGVATLVPLIPGAAFVLDPLLRRKQSSGEGDADEFLQVTTLESLPTDGAPRAFPVIADLQDAWNKFPNTEIGSVFLSRGADGDLTCFNSRCPHLGCTIGYAEQAREFVCPCHASSFTLDGERNNQIPPRSMDPLDAEIRNGNEVWVRFQNFQAGRAARKVVG
ncbi:MAG: Rieske 2Fe-2S domain-containing protein [Planctomyces sp.]|nr:Rieske 2Fe-2S domain-containing protein [Planctomyces sp.]